MLFLFDRWDFSKEAMIALSILEFKSTGFNKQQTIIKIYDEFNATLALEQDEIVDIVNDYFDII